MVTVMALGRILSGNGFRVAAGLIWTLRPCGRLGGVVGRHNSGPDDVPGEHAITAGLMACRKITP